MWTSKDRSEARHLNTLTRPAWTRILRSSLLPGLIALAATFVPWVLPVPFMAHFAHPSFVATLQGLVALLFLLLIGISFRFNRRKALFQTLVLVLFWLGMIAGDAAHHAWLLAWAGPAVLVATAAIAFLPDRRIASISSMIMLIALVGIGLFLVFSLNIKARIPAGGTTASFLNPILPGLWPGSGLFLSLACVVAIVTVLNFFLHPDQIHAMSFWLCCLVVLSVFQAGFFLHRQYFPTGLALSKTRTSVHEVLALPLALYFLFVFIAFHVYSLLEISYHLAYHDQLTGLPGRRAMEEALAHPGKTYCIAMGDVDKFKSFNDKYGHDVGDQVLRVVGVTLAAVKQGKAYRYGGEEFVILFPGLAPGVAALYAEEVRVALGNYRFVLRDKKRIWPFGGKKKRGAKSLQVLTKKQSSRSVIRVTMSIGLATRREREESATVLKRADQALYQAKGAGRDRLVTG